MTDEKFHLIFGMGICGYFFVLIMMICQWFEDGCSENFISIVIASFVIEIIIVALLVLALGILHMFLKFLDD